MNNIDYKFGEITIYPNAGYSNPKLSVNGVKKEIDSLQDLLENCTKNAHSFSVFDGDRSKKNFESTKYLFLDFDGGEDLRSFISYCRKNKINVCVMASRSHQLEKHGKIQDRFHAVFPLSQLINSEEEFDKIRQKALMFFPDCDHSVLEVARFSFQCKGHQDNTVIEGGFIDEFFDSYELDIAKQLRSSDLGEKISKENVMNHPDVMYYTQNAHNGLVGEFNKSLFMCAFRLGVAGYTEEEIVEITENYAPNPLDRTDKGTIKSVMKYVKENRYSSNSLNVSTKNKMSVVEKVHLFFEDNKVNHEYNRGFLVGKELLNISELENKIIHDFDKKRIKVTRSTLNSILNDINRVKATKL